MQKNLYDPCPRHRIVSWTPGGHRNNNSLHKQGWHCKVTVRWMYLVTTLPYPLWEVTFIIPMGNVFFSVCTSVDCGPPVAPRNGSLESYTNTVEGSEVYYRCNQGLVPEGWMRAVCTRNGWSPNPADQICTVGMLLVITGLLCGYVVTEAYELPQYLVIDEWTMS